MGMVLTLVIVVDEDDADDAMEAARGGRRASTPPRILGVDPRRPAAAPARSTPRSASAPASSGETRADPALRRGHQARRVRGAAAAAARLPRRRLVAGEAPEDPADRPARAARHQRRITDAAAVPTGKAQAMLDPVPHLRAGQHRPRLDPDHRRGARCSPRRSTSTRGKVTGASVAAERISPSADLLAAWLGDRLKVRRSTRKNSDGPGITAVVLTHQARATSRIARADGRLATLSVARRSRTGRSRSSAATLAELLAEELRRLDPDDVYAATVEADGQAGQGTST